MLKNTSILKRFLSNYDKSKKIGIIGVPSSKGHNEEGSCGGPAAVRKGGIIEALKNFDANPDLDIKDYGDITYNPSDEKLPQDVNIRNLNYFSECAKSVSDSVRKIIQDNRLCITLGGDHSLALGTIDGHIKSQNEVSVIYVDAHADINTHQTSFTHNPNGMHLSLIVKEMSHFWPPLPQLSWRKQELPAKNLAFIGLRSIDIHEKKLIQDYGIPAFGMTEIDRYGIENVMKMVLDQIDPDQNRSIHISLDTDGLDPRETPATTLAVPGGLTLREGLRIMEIVQSTGRLRAFDITEVNPKKGDAKELAYTVSSVIELIKAAAGIKRSCFS